MTRGVAGRGLLDRGLLDYGGLGADDPAQGVGPIVLVHGLMGRGRTWRRQVPWLRRYGRVFTFDAAFHTGAPDAVLADPGQVSTERFVADLAEILTWIDLGRCAGWSFDGRAALVVCGRPIPGVGVGARGGGHGPGFPRPHHRELDPWFSSWPERFDSPAEAVAMFGPVAGRYFYEPLTTDGCTATWIPGPRSPTSGVGGTSGRSGGKSAYRAW